MDLDITNCEQQVFQWKGQFGNWLLPSLRILALGPQVSPPSTPVIFSDITAYTDHPLHPSLSVISASPQWSFLSSISFTLPGHAFEVCHLYRRLHFQNHKFRHPLSDDSLLSLSKCFPPPCTILWPVSSNPLALPLFSACVCALMHTRSVVSDSLQPYGL